MNRSSVVTYVSHVLSDSTHFGLENKLLRSTWIAASALDDLKDVVNVIFNPRIQIQSSSALPAPRRR